MKDVFAILAFLIIGAVVALLAYAKRMSCRERYCPVCGALAKKLFDEYFKPEAINAVFPEELKEQVLKIIICSEKTCKNFGFEGLMYCPKCDSWNLKLDYGANEGWGFSCQTLGCGFSFSVMN